MSHRQHSGLTKLHREVNILARQLSGKSADFENKNMHIHLLTDLQITTLTLLVTAALDSRIS